MKFNFIQTIKEASQIKHKRNIASAMTKEEHTRLFDSLFHGLHNQITVCFNLILDRFNEFWSINEKLMSSVESGKDGQENNVPVRFYQVIQEFLNENKRNSDHFRFASFLCH